MVSNQSPIFAGHNVYSDDPLLTLATSALSEQGKSSLKALGKWAGTQEILEFAHLANVNLPVLKTHDAKGNRIDQVDYHPSYHAFLRKSVSLGLQGSIWEVDKEEKGQQNVSRAARLFVAANAESGHLNSISLTNASVAALLASPTIADEWLPLITSRKYDASHKTPITKTGVMLGIGISEKQTSSNFNGLETKADSVSNGVWRITGHKWQLSSPMSDAFLIVANTQKGPSCFLMPRILADKSSNAIHIQRLKDKLGNRSNATAEVEFNNSIAQLVGDEGQAGKIISDMQRYLHLDSALVSAGLMRASLAEAVHHCRHRVTSESKLIDQPLMQRVLADMALDVAASTVLSFRLAQSFDRASANPAEAAYRLLMAPVIKYWISKLCPTLISEALECLGGNGYSEQSNLACHYRDAPAGIMLAGPGNLLAIEALKGITSNPKAFETLLAGLERDLGAQGVDKTVKVIKTAAGMAASDVGSARIFVEQLALTAAAAEFKRVGLKELGDAFTETRLGGLWRSSYGMLDTRQNAKSIIAAVFPN